MKDDERGNIICMRKKNLFLYEYKYVSYILITYMDDLSIALSLRDFNAESLCSHLFTYLLFLYAPASGQVTPILPISGDLEVGPLPIRLLRHILWLYEPHMDPTLVDLNNPYITWMSIHLTFPQQG